MNTTTAIAIPSIESFTTPELHEEQVQKVVAKLQQLKKQAEELSVTDVPSAEMATESASIAAKTIKWLETKRDALVRPKNEEVAHINGEFKLLTVPLEQIRRQLNSGLQEYKRELERKEEQARQEQLRLQCEAEMKRQQEIEERHRKGEELRQKEIEQARANNIEAPPPLVIPEPEPVALPVVTLAPEAPKSFTSVTGSASFRKTWKAKVIDRRSFIEAVVKGDAPDALLLIDESGLNKMAALFKDASKAYPGTQFYIHETPVNN